MAVGYQHLANGNLAGAGALLAEGSTRLRDGQLPGIDLEDFANAVAVTVARVGALPEAAIPRFPREGIAT